MSLKMKKSSTGNDSPQKNEENQKSFDFFNKLAILSEKNNDLKDLMTTFKPSTKQLILENNSVDQENSNIIVNYNFEIKNNMNELNKNQKNDEKQEKLEEFKKEKKKFENEKNYILKTLEEKAEKVILSMI